MARRDGEPTSSMLAWRNSSPVKPLRGTTSRSKDSALPSAQETTVNGWLWRNDQKLTEGIHRLMYWPGPTFKGREGLILILITSCLWVSEAREKPYRNAPFLYKKTRHCRMDVERHKAMTVYKHDRAKVRFGERWRHIE